MRVLIVDDEPDVRELARIGFEVVGGHQAVLASNGLEALERLADTTVDAVVMDVQMPELDGPSTLTEIRATFPADQLPVVFLTASVRPEDLNALHELDVSGVLAKPFDPLTLSAEVVELLGRER